MGQNLHNLDEVSFLFKGICHFITLGLEAIITIKMQIVLFICFSDIIFIYSYFLMLQTLSDNKPNTDSAYRTKTKAQC